MSTRYVWGKYNVVSQYEETSKYTDEEYFSGGNTLLIAQSYTFDQNTGIYSLTNPIANRNQDAGTYKCCMPSNTNGSGEFMFVANVSPGYGFYWTIGSAGSGNYFADVRTPDGFQGSSTIMRSKRTYVKGTLQGYSSSNSAGAYPQDGISGSYWYDYQGSDNIDAAGVGYSTTEPRGGEVITIRVTAGSGKRYSGTVSYLYQVQLNGGGWTSLGTTSATTWNYTIPKGTQTFRARVRAQDNLGFTSSTYTTGTQLTVKNSSVYVGVNGAVRNAELAVCVAGTVRSNVSGYACVNGVIYQC